MAEKGKSRVNVKVEDFVDLGDDSIEKQILTQIWEQIGKKKNLKKKTLGILTAEVKNIDETSTTFRCVALSGLAFGDMVAKLEPKNKTNSEVFTEAVNNCNHLKEKFFLAPFDSDRSFYVDIDRDTRTNIQTAMEDAQARDPNTNAKNFAKDFTTRFKNRIEKFRISPEFKACKGSKEEETKVIKEAVENSYHKTQIWKDYKDEQQRKDCLSEIINFYMLCLKSDDDAIETIFLTVQSAVTEEKVVIGNLIRSKLPENSALSIMDDIQRLKESTDGEKEKLKSVWSLIEKSEIRDKWVHGWIAHYVGAKKISTRLLDCFTQCAEDNAVMAMAEKITSLKHQWTSISISWTATSIVKVTDKETGKKTDDVQNKKLCALCSLGFEERARLIFDNILIIQRIEKFTQIIGCHQSLFP